MSSNHPRPDFSQSPEKKKNKANRNSANVDMEELDTGFVPATAAVTASPGKSKKVGPKLMFEQNVSCLKANCIACTARRTADSSASASSSSSVSIDRRKGRANPENDWITFETFPIEESLPRQEAVKRARSNVERYIKNQSKVRIDPWLLWKTYDSDFTKDEYGRWEQKYHCRHSNTGDCNCKLREVCDTNDKKISLQWWTDGSAHGIVSGETFAASREKEEAKKAFEEHGEFEHLRANEHELQDTKLPLRMLSYIEHTIHENPELKAKSLIAKMKKEKGPDNELLFEYSEHENPWTQLDSLIRKRRETVRKTVRKFLGVSKNDTVSDIYAFAKENTYPEVLKRKGAEFTVDDMFVAAMDIKVDEMPSDPKKRVNWEPQVTCRIFITSITMSMFAPAISTGANVLQRITKAADTTYKIFTIDDFHCSIVYVYDGAGNAKVTGYLVTCHENGGDYYLCEKASRNATEYFCSLSPGELPGGVTELPFCLPSPTPPSTKDHPLKYNKDTKKFEQPWDGVFKVSAPSRRHRSRSSREARKKLTDCAKFYIEGVELKEGEIIDCFRCDADGLDFASASDGDKGVPNGLQAAQPCMSNAHSDCGAHIARHNRDRIEGKYQPDCRPIFDWDNLATDDRPRFYNHRKKMFYRFVYSRILRVRNCRNRPLAEAIFQDLLDSLRENEVYYSKADEYDDRFEAINWDKFKLDAVECKDGRGIHIPGNFEKYADSLEESYARITKNGSHGQTRASDLLDLDLTALDENGNATMAHVDPCRLCHGVPFNTNSCEACNGATKDALAGVPGCGGNLRGTVVLKLQGLMEVGKDYGRRERDVFGVSIVPPIFGQGSHGRVTTTRHAEARRIGMMFAGQNGCLDKPICQLNLLHPSRKKGSGLGTVLYLVQGEKELEALWEAATGGEDDIGTERIIEKQQAILKQWFKRHTEIAEAGREKIHELIEDLTATFYKEQLGIAEDESLPDRIDINKKVWSQCRSLAIIDVYEWEQTFVAVMPMEVDEEGAKALEPFRCNYEEEKNFVYRWRCNCPIALKDGVCEHVVFVQHMNWGPISSDPDIKGYTGTAIPKMLINYDLEHMRPRGKR